MTEQQTIETEQQMQDWVREQFQRANKHLAENGVLFDSVVTQESRYLAPAVAIWKIKANDGKFYWVISGDLPSDFTLYENAKTAREAMRHFALHWQLKAQNILNIQTSDQTQQDFANLLIDRAEKLYQVQDNPELWKNDPA